MADDTTGLTRREREVLAGILERKTAKEMALDLGISHHAVEKRLKRARHKLGAATSLEAARRYEERYGQAVSGPSDLGGDPADGAAVAPAAPRRSRRRLFGVSLMLIAIAIAAAAIMHPADETNAFVALDRDGNNFIERNEFLARSTHATRVSEDRSENLDAAEVNALMGRLFGELDKDGDGRLTAEEFGTGEVSFRTVKVRDGQRPPEAVVPRNRYRIVMAPEPGNDPYDMGFEVTDSDRSNSLSRDEFLGGAKTFDNAGYRASGGEDGGLGKLFERLDRDGSGMIERAEYRDLSFTDEDGEDYLFELVYPGKD
ncbi:EF-hand domain-containing protein [Sphingomicrobium aestuariivivum]|uniref:EF-hand domain-containing protein n=1 Tax=Sphingomicrobium aestuariivivum TaxID=1582356 RepID=UPI001FD65131|nr:EF-hand domain-containing protein [Sphingomicrobium aestuariivivum]MCJ8190155.1 EF-hand domain-containing protein [Sphingomicrobium aestuariivivum]